MSWQTDHTLEIKSSVLDMGKGKYSFSELNLVLN